MGPDRVERVLARLRESAPVAMDELFRNGACYQLYLMLREIWPEAEPWYAWKEGHVYTRIGGAWYDIRGKHVSVHDDVAFARLDPRTRAHRWLSRRRAA